MWNHNIHYHQLILRSMPHGCGVALDVGCGQGLLVRALARHSEQVVGIDIDRETLALAGECGASDPRIRFVEGDVMTFPFPAGSFDFITAVAALHHLPLSGALARFRYLLKPGGRLAVVGLYRIRTPLDYAFSAAALPVSWTLGVLRGHAEVGAPVQDPRETLAEIRNAFKECLPGAVVRRHLLFRYSAVWRNGPE